MDKTTLTFEQQGLAVDWVSFTFSSLSCEQEQKLISSFYALGFSLYRLNKLLIIAVLGVYQNYQN